jgi:hypothetical protein
MRLGRCIKHPKQDFIFARLAGLFFHAKRLLDDKNAYGEDAPETTVVSFAT